MTEAPKIVEKLKRTFRKPYPVSVVPDAGPNGLLSAGWKTVRVELRAQGLVTIDGEEAEFMDVRVYHKEISQPEKIKEDK